MTKRRHFQRGGGGVFACAICTRMTRRVDQGGDSELCPQCVERTRLDGLPIVARSSAGWAPRPLASDHRQLVGFFLHGTITRMWADAHESDRPSGQLAAFEVALGGAFRHERTDSSQDARER